VKDVAGPGDVAERAEVDEQVLVDWRQRGPRSTEVRRRRMATVLREVAPLHRRREVDPDVVVAGGEGHQLRPPDRLRRVVAGGGRMDLVDQTGGAPHLRLEAESLASGSAI